MPFTDRRLAKALEIFISRNEKLQKELANLSRHPGVLPARAKYELSEGSLLDSTVTDFEAKRAFAAHWNVSISVGWE